MSIGVKIKKAKIKDDLFLEAEYSQDLIGHKKQDIKISSTVPVHSDMTDAFKKLEKHLAYLCGEKDCPKYKLFDTTDVEGFDVRSFSIGGSDEHEGVTVSGYKDGPFGLVNLNTPFTKFAEGEYPFLDKLSEDVQACIYEVELYLFEGKKAPEQQTSLEFPEDNENIENA
jgi:hypothetical protein